MKSALVLLFCMVSFCSNAQFENRYLEYGLLRFQGNLAFGKPLTRSATSMYFASDVDYYLKGNVSVNGGVFYFVNEYGGQDVFKKNHSLFAGFSYHFPTNNSLDTYVGIQPGVSLSQLNPESPLFIDVVSLSSFEASINPLFSVNAGMNFFANKYFNVFVNVKYQRGKHFSDVSAQSLEELKITLGLGYMLWAREGYCKFRRPEVD